MPQKQILRSRYIYIFELTDSWGNEVKLRYHFTVMKEPHLKQRAITHVVGEDAGKGCPHGTKKKKNETVQFFQRAIRQHLLKLKINMSFELSIPLQGLCLQK